jgi:AbrB family looped-hinge helix DNA binding protein
MPFPPASSPGPGRSLAVRPSRPYPVGSVPPPSRSPPMPKVRLSYDGWLALPADVRKKLGLSTGHQLELELVGGAIVLRQAGAAGPVPAEPAAARPPVEALPPATAPDPAPTVKRGPGRPRKVPAAVALPPNLRARGGRRKAASGKIGG